MHCLIVPCKLRYIEECFSFAGFCSFSFLLLNLRGVRTHQKMIQRACVCKIDVFCRHIKDCVSVEFYPLQFLFFVLRIYYVLFSFFLNCPRTVFVTTSQWEQWKTRIRGMSAGPLPSCCVLKNEQRNNN